MSLHQVSNKLSHRGRPPVCRRGTEGSAAAGRAGEVESLVEAMGGWDEPVDEEVLERVNF